MRKPFESIAFGETSFDVELLHQVLAALGFAVSGDEASGRKAGEDTRAKVRALQAQLHVPTDTAPLVGAATARAIEAALQERGLVAASRTFTVSGTVKGRDGSVKRRQRLLVFDVDLRGVAVYRTVKSGDEIARSGGFEYLGEDLSDARGNYTLTFYDWQYRRAERLKADVIVFAVESGDGGGRVLGRSRLVNSDDYLDTGVVRGLDVAIAETDPRTEYESVMSVLPAFLKESEVTLVQLAGSVEQMAFTASELETGLARVTAAAGAAQLAAAAATAAPPSHELLYALGRQDIALDFGTLGRLADETLRAAIAKSIADRIVQPFDEAAIAAFLAALRARTVTHVLREKPDDKNSVHVMLSHALPDEPQRIAFVNAVASFAGADPADFWHKHLPEQPAFKNKPKLIEALLLTEQLTLLTGNHQALVADLQVNRRLPSAERLIDLSHDQWIEAIKRAGVPPFVEGATDEAKAETYARQLEAKVDAAFPTARIARLVSARDFPIATGRQVAAFLEKTPTFDFARSRVHDFDREIASAAGDQAGAVRRDLMKLQRVYQVSTRPGAMAALLRHDLHSAYSIANVPRTSFVNTYGADLGGPLEAYAIHQRASHIATRTEMAAMHVHEYANAHTPSSIVGAAERRAVERVLRNAIPNYEQLFGSPDICECEHCRSVFSPAAYFVDLLRFLLRSGANSAGQRPLDLLEARRPDLLSLPLSCENTNTIIPYIDLANEVMEYYVAHDDSLATFKGYDTGEATAQELRANPQNFDLEAYRRLKDAKFPFTLPYHQPLDVIRVHSDHLKVSRYEAMRAMNPAPDAAAANALAAEALRISQEEFRVLTGLAFDGTADPTPLHAYFGYNAAPALEGMSEVPEFLRRSGVVYTDLVELVKTRFINPTQTTLEFIDGVFASSSIGSTTLYVRLQQIAAGTLDPAADGDITAALAAYNAARGTTVTPAAFGAWVVAHFAELQQTITLYEPQSRCELDTTRLRTIQSIYENAAASGITNQTWSKAHRFIRLWRKLGWTIHETDLMLAALGEADITDATIRKLESVWRIRAATRLAVNQTAVLWGPIDAYGDQSLYRKLFLNKAVQQIDPAFQADAWGGYLQDATQVLADHKSAILAAFRIREDDLTAILGVARVIDAAVPRPLALATDALNLGNLTTIYRHVALARALKFRVADLCTLIALFDVAPFSSWDVQLQAFVNVNPGDTYAFYELAASTKATGFKASVLEYVLDGTLPPDSTLGLDPNKVLLAARDVRGTFSSIEDDHPDTPPSPLPVEVVAAKLALTFQPEMVARFLASIDGTATFEASADANLTVAIPDPLASRFTYVRGSGRLIAFGVMTDEERAALQALANINGSFVSAVDDLYHAPETLVATNFDGIFADLAEANAVLFNHPAQVTASTIAERLAYVYTHFVPVLKRRLRRDGVTQHIAAVIRLSEEATALVAAPDVESLIADLSTEGFSATYFNDTTWTAAVESTTDPAVDFDWGSAAPRAGVNADAFSVRWQAYLAPPVSGEHTFVVSVLEADEAFRLYLDDALILEKAAANPTTSWEVVVTLNAARMHRLVLEYAETSQDAGVRLQWKTATTALETVPPPAAYPAAILDAFVALATLYHRAAKLIATFRLTETELSHFMSFPADFGGLDFKALDANAWRRLRDYTALTRALPQAQALVTDVFAAANTANPVPVVSALTALVVAATAWDAPSVEFLVTTKFALGVDDFKNEVALGRLRDVMAIVARTGLTSETIAAWGAVETDFDVLHATAQLLKNTVKAKYEETDWLDIAGRLSDTIRAHQQQALIAYLLTRPAIKAWGAADADALFEYFLIDVQMGACMDTSRIVQANASVQMFVNRCLLNLESDMSSGSERGVSPGAIDKDRWEWMKAYRVWEANRKVFVYPENWLEPEWRNDRSEFFKALESYLVQNDITDRSVEQGFRDYLASLSEVAGIEVCGMHRENYDDGTLKYLHVFGRTRHTPFKYYYRRWNEYQKWSAWERVQADVRGVEAADKHGLDHSGVHLIPIVWKKRLFLFWPEFTEKKEAPAKSDKSVKDVSEDKISTLEPSAHWEVKLAWSEYVDGKWTPKQVSTEFIYQDHWYYIPTPGEHSLRFATEIDSADNYGLGKNALLVYFVTELPDPRDWYLEGAFEIPDITSRIVGQSDGFGHAHEQWDERYVSDYQSVTVPDGSKLELFGNTYLNQSTYHWILTAADIRNFDARFDEPFFFRDPYRTYFVRPITVRLRDPFKRPDLYTAYLPLDVNTRVPAALPIPHGGVGDFTPVGAGPIRMHGSRRGPGGLSGAQRMTLAPGGADAWTDVGTIGSAFEGALAVAEWDGPLVATRYGLGLEFHTFYHPFSNDYVTRLNEDGIDRLMEADTSIPSDGGSTFEDYYLPNARRVPRPADFATRTYYKENVCFDVYGANASYNWELFFHAPLYIATRLSKNGKYPEAMAWFHYIFDPTTDELPGPGQTEVSRYWKVRPFKHTPATSLEDWFRSLGPNGDPNTENAIIAEWRDHPFDPHLVASNRPLAYMKNVVIKYVENLVAWGDSLFRQDTMESVNEALQIYVMANHILGPRPQFVPRRGEIKVESYASLADKWDDFSNALVELENIFPYSGDVSVSTESTGTSLLGVGSALYFCIPANDKLIQHWDTVADRLYKIRHCQNIEGVERKLALFAPPIDPALLIQATAQGLSLGSILADLSSPPPIYRFTFLLQKANELCADLRALGAGLLAALEKKDAEELSRLRASHEVQMLELTTAIRERQVLIARSNKENLEKARETAAFRLRHYTALIGNDVTPPAAPVVSATLTADSSLPGDTTIAEIQAGVDESLVESGESGVKLIHKEKEELDNLDTARDWQIAAQTSEALAAIVHVIPTVKINGMPLGVGGGAAWGGTQLGNAIDSAAKIFQFISSFSVHSATMAAKMASYVRREQDWTFQANLAAKDITALDKQLVSAAIQVQVAQTELANHKQGIENARQVEQFLLAKFSGQELYQWMKEQLFAVYKQSYNLCYEMAKKAEKAFQHELGADGASVIQYGYWDNSKQGLVAGDRLQLALRQLDRAYLDDNRRELELTKNISLARLDPLALIELRETGRCRVSLPEELFDLDFRGHYFRRIKGVRLSIPCVAGPHTSIGCTLRLLSSTVRVNTAMNSGGDYEHENDGGEWIDDDRFRATTTPVTAVATSQGQSDPGMFEFNFRDERYLPFERAGAISEWQVELSTDREFRQFDYETITDVIMHVNYTAREDTGFFKQRAAAHLQDFLLNAGDVNDQPLIQMLSLRHEVSSEWYRFLHPAVAGADQVLDFTVGTGRFPFFVQDRDLAITRIDLFARCTQETSYDAILSYLNRDGDTVTSSQFALPRSAEYGDVNKATLGATDAGLDLEDLDIAAPITLKLKRSAATNFHSLATDPDEVEDVFLVLGYKVL